LFTMSTGGMEHFIPGCNTTANDAAELMRPTFNSDHPPSYGLPHSKQQSVNGTSTTTYPYGTCTDSLTDSGKRVYYAVLMFSISSIIAYLFFAIYNDFSPRVKREMQILKLLERRHAVNHNPLPVSEDLLFAAKHTFARTTKRWRSLADPQTYEEADLAHRFPFLLDPLNGLIVRAIRGAHLAGENDQLHSFMHTLLGVDLTPTQLDQIWNEADLDKSGSLSFAEVVCLLNPDYTSLSLRATIPELQNPQDHFSDPGEPGGLADSFMGANSLRNSLLPMMSV